jgi:predicted metal-dependent phosphoesterase TrpH/glycosyltransferase involved in cell wall biosynthesis
MDQRFAIAHVTPYPWESEHEVNAHVAAVAGALRGRGHDVLVLAPSRSAAIVRETRRLLRGAREHPQRLFAGPADSRAGVPVLAVGEVLDLGASARARPQRARRRAGALPVDAARTLDELFALLPLDFVHVHEPFPPSLASAALRHSRALNVGSFHAPTEPLLSAQVVRRFVEGFFGRLDARTASFAATARLLEAKLPGDYRVVPPACPDPARVPASAQGPVRVLFLAREERAALRTFLRGLRQRERASVGEPGAAERARDSGPAWEVTVVGPTDGAAAGGGWELLREPLREHVRFRPFPGPDGEQELLAQADILVCASGGAAPAPTLVLRALAHGVAVLASRVPVYDEILGEGKRGLLFEPGDTETVAAQLDRLIADPALRARLAAAGARYARAHTSERIAAELLDLYGDVAARRRPAPAARTLRRRGAREAPLVDVDLHMHTDHSPDCATPVEVLLATARERGLGAIAVTDHNEISGALRARGLAEEAGVRVIVGEEVKTASEGEVIGLFIEEKIPRGMTLAETIAEIRRQGGLVYVPHPFDRLHAVPDYEHLLPIVHEIDAIEVFNPRVAIDTFNDEALRFAAKYRIPAGAGSDAHVPQGLGSVRVRMRPFEGAEEFMSALREAQIVTRPRSLLYVQALKFLQTRATPAPARRARSARQVRRLASRSGG